MGALIEFGLLGPLTVRHDGVPVPVRPGKQRALLAALLLSHCHVVSLDELAEVLWGDSPPPSARVSIQNNVVRLRRALGPAGSRISTQPRGYLLRVDASELDVVRFEAYLKSARAAARDGEWAAAAAGARTALAVWRGEPLDGVDSDRLLSRNAPRLSELRLQALEARIDADLHLGGHAGVIAELRQQTAAYPMREHLYGQLMLALYRDGRQAEALTVYRDARRVLADELGIEPDPRLRELHQRILTADPVLDIPAPVRGAAASTPAGLAPLIPRELPVGVQAFTGRADELRELTRLLDGPTDGQAPMLITAIGGTAGIGKTALAVQWAHQVAGRFPGGQLYVNLRGYDPGPPMPAAEALAGFLRSLGVPGQDIPPREDDRAAHYRSQLAGQQILVILDNAGSAEQVRPLLPGSPSCTVVVTSRDALPGLVARDGAARLELDVLPLAEAVALLRTLIGARVDAEPAAAAELAGYCCRLPLALRVAAELAASRPATPLAELAGEMADLRARLDLLAADGDPRTQVRAVFSWSYRHLTADDARTFRLLGLHPGPGFDSYAAAALTGTTREQASKTLGRLTHAHLTGPAGPDRYGLHDLLRAYARELAASTDGAQEERAALTRLFDFYLHCASTAMAVVFPGDHYRRPRIPEPIPDSIPGPVPGPGACVPPLIDAASARAWLDAERTALAAGVAHASGHGWAGHAIRLSDVLYRYLLSGDHISEALTIHTGALCAARQTGDRAAEAAALTSLAAFDWVQDRLEQAADRSRAAVALFRETGDKCGEGRAMLRIGSVDWELGRHQQATDHLRHAVELAHAAGDWFGEGRALSFLGGLECQLGHLGPGIDLLERALTRCRRTGDTNGEGYTLARLGEVHAKEGRYQQAVRDCGRAMDLFRQTGERAGEARVLTVLGQAGIHLGQAEQAVGHQRRAVHLYREINNLAGVADALNCLGEALLAVGQPGPARSQHAAALSLARQIGNQLAQARAHDGLARTLPREQRPQSAQARSHWEQALAIYTEFDVPEAVEVQAKLAADGQLAQ